jgi:transaldolase
VKLFLESASLVDIQWAIDSRLVDGVYVTPGTLDQDAFGVDPVEQVEQITRRTADPILAVAGAVTADDLYAAGRDLARVSDQISVVVPFVEDGMDALRRLNTEGIRTVASFVVTPAQALLASKCGAVAVIIAADHLDQHGHDADAVLHETVALFSRHAIACDVLGAASGSARVATQSMLAGADGVTLTAAALRALAQHPLTDRALDQMLGELSRRPRPRLSK